MISTRIISPYPNVALISNKMQVVIIYLIIIDFLICHWENCNANKHFHSHRLTKFQAVKVTMVDALQPERVQWRAVTNTSAARRRTSNQPRSVSLYGLKLQLTHIMLWIPTYAPHWFFKQNVNLQIVPNQLIPIYIQ